MPGSDRQAGRQCRSCSRASSARSSAAAALGERAGRARPREAHAPPGPRARSRLGARPRRDRRPRGRARSRTAAARRRGRARESRCSSSRARGSSAARSSTGCAIEGPKEPIEVSGTAVARGRVIRLEDGSALVGGERVALGGFLRPRHRHRDARRARRRARSWAPCWAHWPTAVPLEGTLGSKAGLELAGGLETLRGPGPHRRPARPDPRLLAAAPGARRARRTAWADRFDQGQGPVALRAGGASRSSRPTSAWRAGSSPPRTCCCATRPAWRSCTARWGCSTARSICAGGSSCRARSTPSSARPRARPR